MQGHHFENKKLLEQRKAMAHRRVSIQIGTDASGIPPSAWVAGGNKHHEWWLEERRWIETPSGLMDMDLDDRHENDDRDYADNHAERNGQDTYANNVSKIL